MSIVKLSVRVKKIVKLSVRVRSIRGFAYVRTYHR
jgi:hypothetical protein